MTPALAIQTDSCVKSFVVGTLMSSRFFICCFVDLFDGCLPRRVDADA